MTLVQVLVQTLAGIQGRVDLAPLPAAALLRGVWVIQAQAAVLKARGPVPVPRVQGRAHKEPAAVLKAARMALITHRLDRAALNLKTALELIAAQDFFSGPFKVLRPSIFFENF